MNNICEKDLKWLKKEEEMYFYLDRNTPVGEVRVFDLALKNQKNKDSKDEHKVNPTEQICFFRAKTRITRPRFQ